MNLIKVESSLRNKLRKKVRYLKVHGDDNNAYLPKTMIANKIGISPVTLDKVMDQKSDIEVSENVYYKLKEWIEK